MMIGPSVSRHFQLAKGKDQVLVSHNARFQCVDKTKVISASSGNN